MADKEQLISMEEALKELQIERDELKELFRQNALRYVLESGKIKIPKMAVMALKLERMTSNTQQFAKIQRSRRKRESNLTMVSSESMLSLAQAGDMLHIDQDKLQEYINTSQLRTIEIEGDKKISQVSARILQLQLQSFDTMANARLPRKNRPQVRRVY